MRPVYHEITALRPIAVFKIFENSQNEFGIICITPVIEFASGSQVAQYSGTVCHGQGNLRQLGKRPALTGNKALARDHCIPWV